MVKFFRIAGKLLGFKPLEEADLGDKKEDSLFIATKSTVEISEKSKTGFSDEKLANAIFDIQATLKKMYHRFEVEEIDEEQEIKWKYAAIVMDRIFLILTLLLTIITFISIIMSIPNFYKAT